MNFQFHPFVIPFLIVTLISAGVATIIWQRRHAPGAMSLFAHVVGLVIWSGSLAAMWVSKSVDDQVFWLNVSALGVVIIPVSFLTFCIRVTYNDRLLTRWLIFGLALEPLAGLILVWTNDLHHLVYSPAGIWFKQGLAELQWQPGLWYYVDGIYMYYIMSLGIWFLVRSLWQIGELHRRQIAIIMMGVSIPLVGNLILLSPVSNSLGQFDTSPILYTVASLHFVYAMAQRKFLDLIPVAHSLMVKSMTDGVIVLDLQDRIVDMNPAAGQFLSITPGQVIGRPAREILSDWEPTTHSFWDKPEVRTEIKVIQDIPRIIDLKVTPLMDSRTHSTGRMLVFRDITSQKRNEINLHAANVQLREQLTQIRALRDRLHEQATRDPLTNLYNRRYLEEKLSQELARAERENYPICLIMMDIDRFKLVNDTCGHKIGDEVLQSLASLIVLHIRRFDAACRYGGEEFVIVMPKLSVETARERAEFLRQEFSNMALLCPNMKTGPTLSIGVAAFPFDGSNAEQLLKAADDALYAAKSTGRNRVVVYSELEDKQTHSNK